MKKHRKLISALLFSAAALSGCTTIEPGSPSAEGSTADAGSPSNSLTSSPSSNSPAVPDACTLLEKVAGQFNLTNMEKMEDGRCRGDLPEIKSVRIKIYPDLGMDQHNPGSQGVVSEININGRPGKLVEKSLTQFDCTVVLELTKTSRVDVFASASVTGDPCTVAKQFATAIEPELPRS